MAEKKKCPLITIAAATDGGNLDCCEGECAWWDTVEESCAIALLGAESGLRLREKDEGRPWR